MKVMILLGSKSDYPVVQKAEEILGSFGVEYETDISSAHRNPDQTADLARKAEERGFEVIIAAAGMAAHLAGVTAAYSVLPVIGIPMKSANLEGMDALLATVQMPSGVPVACVAIDGAKNAALLAVQILSVKYPELREKFREYKNNL